MLACRAALVFLDAMEQGGFERVRQAGVTLGEGLDALARRYPVITDIRGAGLMRGLEMPADTAARVVEGALGQQLLVNRTAGSVVRMLPPLSVSDAEIDKAVGILAEVLDTLQ